MTQYLELDRFDPKLLYQKFSSAGPFEHVVIDNFFPDEIAQSVLNEIDSDNHDTWDKRNHEHIQVKWRSNWQSDSDIPPTTKQLIWHLNSGDFLRWMSQVTGIQGIIPDPYLSGGGFNQINPGGTLAVHADGNWHDLMGVHRRLNLILYLNKNWQADWNGDLELWSRTNDNKPLRCETTIEPQFNRLVIFRTDDFSFHGHPKPLCCPPDRSRRSLILYYYTNTRPAHEVQDLDLHHRALFHHPQDIGIHNV